MSGQPDPFKWIMAEMEHQKFTTHDRGSPSSDGKTRWILCRFSGKSHLIFACLSHSEPEALYRVAAGFKCDADHVHIVTISLGRVATIDWGTLAPFFSKKPLEITTQEQTAEAD